MARTHSWNVVCINTDEESAFDDCRQITEIGFLAPTIRMKSVSEVASRIRSGLSNFHIPQGDDELPLQFAKDQRMYVRTLDDDSSDDPLLSLPSEHVYKSSERFKNL